MNGANLVAKLSSSIEAGELKAIADLGLVSRLRQAVLQPGLAGSFGRLFHPIRYSFVHVNFIVGARQEMHEIFWAGLARNLYEESGGGETPAHNELYRRFLRTVGVHSDVGIKEARFARVFNERWRNFARDASLEDAVLGIAVYEVLDRPDYQSLHNALVEIDRSWDLEFFRLHSIVEHFDMFSEFVAWYFESVGNPEQRFAGVRDFVLNTQKDMWIGLLSELENLLGCNGADSGGNTAVISSNANVDRDLSSGLSAVT